MARVELSAVAVEDLDRLILTHSLSIDTRPRLRRSLRVLEAFPLIGRELTGRWGGMRFVLGPWRWLLVVYRYEAAEDLVIVLTIQDARSSASATSVT
ncbi:MAG TPA: type II toxin-antitoxin system RelE/ParE family toxin [Solirubrobacteraceae bacterium]